MNRKRIIRIVLIIVAALVLLWLWNRYIKYMLGFGRGNGDELPPPTVGYDPSGLAEECHEKICSGWNIYTYPKVAQKVVALTKDQARILGDYYKDTYGKSLYQCFMDEWDDWDGWYAKAADHLHAAVVE